MSEKTKRISTGIEGLDEITDGGFIKGRKYMIDGPAGAGKSLLGLEFLTAATAQDKNALYINFEESTDAIKANAQNIGLEVDGIEFLDLSPKSDVFTQSQSYDIFSAKEVEGDDILERIMNRIEEVEPDRVFIDPLTQLQYLTADDYQFRKQVIGFAKYLQQRGATLLYSARETDETSTADLEFIGDGTIRIELTEFGRILSVPKFRGSPTRSGEHILKITDDGLLVFSELQPDLYSRSFEFERLSAGVPELDEMLHGGIERGTVTIFSGPTGVGKTTLGTQFMKEDAGRGDRSVLYLFEESSHTFFQRSEAVSIPVKQMQDKGTLEVVEVEPASITPQEFAHDVRDQVENQGADMIMIDGLAGFRLSLLGREDELTKHVHALGRYLKNMGVTTILIEEIKNVTGTFEATDQNTSYLADNLLFLRHIELDGELKKTVGMLKKRTSDYGRQLREFQITEHGIKVGDPMTNVRGILEGTPERVSEVGE